MTNVKGRVQQDWNVFELLSSTDRRGTYPAHQGQSQCISILPYPPLRTRTNHSVLASYHTYLCAPGPSTVH